MATFKNQDQAEHLRTETKKNESFEFNTSSLPSRKEVHGKKKQKIKWKIKYPLLKILTFFFILLIISTFAIYSFLTNGDSVDKANGDATQMKGETASGNQDGVIIDIVDDEEPETDAAKESNEDKEKEEKQEKETTTEDNQETAPTSSDKTTSTNGQGSSNKDEITGTNGNSETEKPSPESDGYKVVEHVVKAQETVFRISMNYYNSQEGIELIKEWNGLTSNDLRVGQVLKIPLKE